MTDLLRPSPPPSWRERVSVATAAARARPAVAAAIGLVAVAAAVVGVITLAPASSPPPLTLPRAPHVDAGGAATTATSTSEVVVHVAGAVVHPGIQRLGGGARVTDALAAAGGPSPDADLDQLNLAARVADGDRVYVPRRGESAPPAVATGGAAAKPAPVDLNAATPDELDTLPGVGPATAAAIVEYRTRHGRFRSVDELVDVPGIGPAKLAALRPKVRV